MQKRKKNYHLNHKYIKWSGWSQKCVQKSRLIGVADLMIGVTIAERADKRASYGLIRRWRRWRRREEIRANVEKKAHINSDRTYFDVLHTVSFKMRRDTVYKNYESSESAQLFDYLYRRFPFPANLHCKREKWYGLRICERTRARACTSCKRSESIFRGIILPTQIKTKQKRKKNSSEIKQSQVKERETIPFLLCSHHQ